MATKSLVINQELRCSLREIETVPGKTKHELSLAMTYQENHVETRLTKEQLIKILDFLRKVEHLL